MVREEGRGSQCLSPVPTAPLHWLTSSRSCVTASWPSMGTKCHTSILTRDCERRLPREPSHPSGSLPPPAPHPLSRAQRHSPARSAPQPSTVSAASFPRGAGSGSACPACSTWLVLSLPPSAAGCVPASTHPSCPGRWLRFLCLPPALRLACLSLTWSLGPARHRALSLGAQSTVLPLKAGALPSNQEPNHIAALNHHSGLLPRAGSCLGRWEETCPLCTGSTPKSRDQCLDHAFLALRFTFYSLCDCYNPGEK